MIEINKLASSYAQFFVSLYKNHDLDSSIIGFHHYNSYILISTQPIRLIDFITEDITENNGFIFDPVRRIKLAILPEELVRQAMLRFLYKTYGIPYSRMAVEKEIQVFRSKKRFDILVYSKLAEPYILIECKAPHIPIAQTLYDQLSAYNIYLKAPYACITNGNLISMVTIDPVSRQINQINSLPHYPF